MGFALLDISPQRSVLLSVLFAIVLVAMVVWTVDLVRERRRLLRELTAMGNVTPRDVEFDMVLRSMRLCTWRIDVDSGEFRVESDYMDRGETNSFFENMPIKAMIAKVAKWDRERIANAMDDLCAGKTDEYHVVYERELPLTGDTFWLESFASVAERHPDGRPKTIVGTTMDIDKQKKLEKALTEARNKAEESDRLKTDFLNNISHEVRTPLNAIVGFSDVITTIEGEERKQVGELIRNNAHSLLRIFDDMVKMSDMEARVTTAIVQENFSVNQMVRDIVDEYARKNTNPNLRIFKRKLPTEIYVGTDRSKLSLIVEHFVSNAIKFTKQGEIEVICEQKTPMHVKISVRDTGKGISPDAQKLIFERFVKLDHFTQGTGLGLSVCRLYAKNLGGNVGVESQLGKGSIFWVEI